MWIRTSSLGLGSSPPHSMGCSFMSPAQDRIWKSFFDSQLVRIVGVEENIRTTVSSKDEGAWLGCFVDAEDTPVDFVFRAFEPVLCASEYNPYVLVHIIWCTYLYNEFPLPRSLVLFIIIIFYCICLIPVHVFLLIFFPFGPPDEVVLVCRSPFSNHTCLFLPTLNAWNGWEWNGAKKSKRGGNAKKASYCDWSLFIFENRVSRLSGSGSLVRI